MAMTAWIRVLRAVVFTMSMLFSVGCGNDPQGPGSYHAMMQAAANAEEGLKNLGAKLERKQYPPGAAWAIDLTGKDVTDATFESMKGLDRIAELNLSDTPITDAQMKHFADSRIGGTLVDINLSNTAITDQGLGEVKESLYLMKLNLKGTKVSDAGVSQWQKARAADPRVSANFKTVKVTR
jgi:hypothetical protein